MPDNTWKLAVWGVRGSAVNTAAAGGFGGDTTCFGVEHPDWPEGIVILDAGTGISRLGAEMRERGRCREAELLISHLHLDHLIGLTAFPPLWDPGLSIRIHGPTGFAEAVDRLLSPPYWPVRLCEFPAKVTFCEHRPGDSFAAGPFSVATMEGGHPNGCVYYRLENGGKRLAFALDCELSDGLRPGLAEFARGADMLIWDAHFAPGDLVRGWGHSTWEEGARLAEDAGVKRVLMAHFGRDHTDAELSEQERLTKDRDQGCIFAREGTEILI